MSKLLVVLVLLATLLSACAPTSSEDGSWKTNATPPASDVTFGEWTRCNSEHDALRFTDIYFNQSNTYIVHDSCTGIRYIIYNAAVLLAVINNDGEQIWPRGMDKP